MWHERDELENAVAGEEQKLAEKDELCDVWQELDNALSSDKIHQEHTKRLVSEMELSRLSEI